MRRGTLEAPAAPVVVTARRVTHENGGARILVRTPDGQRRMPFDHGARNPYVAAILAAYGAADIDTSAVTDSGTGTLTDGRIIRARAAAGVRRYRLEVAR